MLWINAQCEAFFDTIENQKSTTAATAAAAAFKEEQQEKKTDNRI